MQPELLSLFAQVPVVGIFLAYVVYARRQEATERQQREDAWRSFLGDEREARTESMGSLAAAIRELSATQREAADKLAVANASATEAIARQQQSMRRQLSRIAALTLSNSSEFNAESASKLLRDLVED